MNSQCLICKTKDETDLYLLKDSGIRVPLCIDCSKGFEKDDHPGYWKGRKILARMCTCICHRYDHPTCPYDNQCDRIDKLQDVIYDDVRGKALRNLDIILASVCGPITLYSISPTLLSFLNPMPDILPDWITIILGVLGTSGFASWINRNTRGSCFR